MKAKPDLDAFRSGGSEGALETAARQDPVPARKPVPSGSERANKTIRLRKDLETRLKEDSHRRSMSENTRVTESDIIEEALAQYFGIPL